MPKVFVVSEDRTLRAAVRAELREAGVEALGMETPGEVGEMLARGVAPDAVVVDGEALEEAAARDALENLARRVALLVVDSRVMPAPPLPGAQRLLRPVRVREIVERVLALLAGRAA
jgi:AmiR/NasT family two-component response regulator